MLRSAYCTLRTIGSPINRGVVVDGFQKLPPIKEVGKLKLETIAQQHAQNDDDDDDATSVTSCESDTSTIRAFKHTVKDFEEVCRDLEEEISLKGSDHDADVANEDDAIRVDGEDDDDDDSSFELFCQDNAACSTDSTASCDTISSEEWTDRELEDLPSIYDDDDEDDGAAVIAKRLSFGSHTKTSPDNFDPPYNTRLHVPINDKKVVSDSCWEAMLQQWTWIPQWWNHYPCCSPAAKRVLEDNATSEDDRQDIAIPRKVQFVEDSKPQAKERKPASPKPRSKTAILLSNMRRNEKQQPHQSWFVRPKEEQKNTHFVDTHSMFLRM